jgi:hypothetical protein
MSNTKTLQLPDFLMKLWAKEIAANDDKYREDNNAQLGLVQTRVTVFQGSGGGTKSLVSC